MSLKLIVAAVSLMFPAISVFESTSFITPAAKIHSHGLTTDRNHVDNMDVSVAGADANGIYDFKAGFGASGSQQTMTCTANATQTLSHCTAGDFKMGSTIYIQGAGVRPTISTPSAPAVACVAQNRASCQGGVTYCYKIAAIQSAPNGAMTAASAPGCATQPAQTYPPAVNDVKTPVVFTTVVLPYGTRVRLYAVYRSVNGGGYSFYTLLPPQTFKDYNDHASIFTYADVGFASGSPPSSPVPNDVYARITAVNGSTYTLGALSAQPKYNENGAEDQLPGYPYYPSTPTFFGPVTVQHDDTPAFYAAAEAFRANSNSGPLQLHIPAGSYNLHSADPYGLGAMVHLNLISNLTIAGDGDATKLYVSNDRGYRYTNAFQALCGYGAINVANNCIGSAFAALGGPAKGTAYNLVDPVPVGAAQVSLARPSDASHFTVGGYVTIYNNATGYSPNAQEMYGELNKVRAIDSSKGTLFLVYPANKYYSAILTPPYSACSLCAAQPQISPINPSPGRSVMDHITLKDFWFRGVTQFLNINTFDYLTDSNLTIITNEKESEGVGRHRYVYNERLTEDGGLWGQGTYFATAAAGSADILVSGSHYVNQHFGNNSQPCSEGSVNIVWKNNVFDISGFESSGSISPGVPFGAGAASYGCEFSNNIVNLHNTHFSFFVDLTDGTGSTYIHGNTFNIDSVGANQSILQTLSSRALRHSHLIVDGSNTWHIGKGDGPRVNGRDVSFPGLTSQTLSPQSGAIAVYPYLARSSVLVIPMSGNITSVNLGEKRVLGLRYWLAFLQPAADGPHSLPAACSSWGSAFDCGGGGPPVANPARGSTTYLELYDDGTTVHCVARTDGVKRSE